MSDAPAGPPPPPGGGGAAATRVCRCATSRATGCGTDATLFRAHTAGLGPWWFCSDGSGRFDLPAPAGTCYVATSAVAAVRERLGVVLGGAATVPAALLEGVVVSRLQPPARPQRGQPAGRRGPPTSASPASSRPWCPTPSRRPGPAPSPRADLEGVRYAPRFTTGPALAVALFADSGDAGWPVDAAPLEAADVPGAPLAMPAPRRMDLTVVRPPRTRTRRR